MSLVPDNQLPGLADFICPEVPTTATYQDTFWNPWLQEHLTTLFQGPKKTEEQQNIKIGDIFFSERRQHTEGQTRISYVRPIQQLLPFLPSKE